MKAMPAFRFKQRTMTFDRLLTNCTLTTHRMIIYVFHMNGTRSFPAARRNEPTHAERGFRTGKHRHRRSSTVASSVCSYTRPRSGSFDPTPQRVRIVVRSTLLRVSRWPVAGCLLHELDGHAVLTSCDATSCPRGSQSRGNTHGTCTPASLVAGPDVAKNENDGRN